MTDRSTLKTDTPLSQLMIRKMVNAKYSAANVIAPFVPVSKKSDMFYVFDNDNARIDDTALDGEGGTNEVDFELTTDNYLISDYGLKKYIHPDVLNESDDVIVKNIRKAVAMYLTDKLIVDRELRCSNYFFNAGSMSGRTTALDESEAFDNPNSDVLDVLDNCFEEVRYGSQPANTAIMNGKVWRKIRRHPQLVRLIGDPLLKVLTLEMFKGILESQGMVLSNIIIADMTYNTAAKGATPVWDDVWSDMFLASYVDPSVNTVMEDTFAKTFYKEDKGIQIVFYPHPDPDKEGLYCRAKTNYVFKRTNKNAGYLLTNVLRV